MYGYTLSLLGDSIGASYTFEPFVKVPTLAWDYIDRKPGASRSEVIDMIKLDLLTDPCPPEG